MNNESFTSNTMYENTLSFFLTLLKSQNTAHQIRFDIHIKNEEEKRYLYIDKSTLVFSLEGLYHHIKLNENLTYNEYRRIIYASNLNEELAYENGKISNYKHELSIKTNLYCLIPLN